MRFSKNLFAAALAAIGGSTSAVSAQALTEQVVERFDAVDKVQFVSGDWNPADGDTVWLTRTLGSSVNGTNANELEFAGTALTASFSASTDPWETVSIQSLSGRQLALAGARELQLLLKPNYQSERAFVSVLLRLTMRDGSMWDQTKVVQNRSWQRAAFPVSQSDFARVSWGPQGSFDLSAVASWQVILVDLPAGQHSIELFALHAKRPTAVNTQTAEPFGTRFYSTGAALPNPQSDLLFRRGDWNTNDGDTDWLYHRHKVSTSWSTNSFLQASYRSAGDPWETVSIYKPASTRFELAGAQQIVARLSADANLDPNALVLSLTMQDGSVWQQGKPIDAVNSLGYVPGNGVGIPYRFALDSNGSAWTRAAWGPAGFFDLNRVRSWELYFNNLGTGVHEIQLQGVELATIASSTPTSYLANGQAHWLTQLPAADGVRATITASGNSNDQLTAQGAANAAAGFLVEVTSSYANSAADAATFRLSTDAGETRELSFPLQPGRTLMRIHTSCPALPPGVMARPPAEMEARCRSLQGPFYAIDPSKFSRWQLQLKTIPAGQHNLKLAVFPQVE